MVALPTLVASLFGMNVRLPFQDHPLAFVLVLLVAVGLAALVTRVFVRRGWF